VIIDLDLGPAYQIYLPLIFCGHSRPRGEPIARGTQERSVQMSLQKRFLKSKPVCKVTFKLPKQVAGEAGAVCLVGEFNGWDTAATPMKKLKSGDFTVTLDLETGREYQFRYLIDGDRWQNDEAADRYVPSAYPGVDNSVVVA
jgi:1,4-alpha-glucan branching enzyme